MSFKKSTEQKRVDSPYGIPPSMIIYDKTKDEMRSFKGGMKRNPESPERFGEPYRSENRGERLDRSERRPTTHDRAQDRQDRGQDRGQDRTPHQARSMNSRNIQDRDTVRPQSRSYDRSGNRNEREDTRHHYETRNKYDDRSRRGGGAMDRGMERGSERPLSERGHQKGDQASDEDFDIRSKEVIIPLEDLKEIRLEICQRMEGKKFTIVEGIVDPVHDTSVYFSESKMVETVFTFIGKKNPELIGKLEKCGNVQIIEDSFVYTPAEVKNPFVLFLYPYWLMSMDEKNTKNVYFKNIPLQSGTFDDILRIEQADLFVFVIPNDVRVPDDYGVKSEISLSRGKLVFIQPKRNSVISSSTINKNLSEEEWDKSFEIFLKNTLAPVAKEDIIHKIINSNTLSMWKKAFTHETIDLNDNYEQLETIGDRVLELCFLKYLLRKFPDLSPQEITELKSKYMSKIYQGTTSRKLGFGNWTRVGNDISSISILEDVFESFFGALFEISDDIIGDGVGYVLCLKFLTLIFEDVKFDLSKAQGHPRSQIKEIFEMLKLDPEIQDVVISEKGTNVTISITEHTHNELIELEKIPKNSSRIIGIGFGPYKTNAVNLAYSNALEYLEGIGVTRKWAEQQKELYDLMVPELDLYIENALERMASENYTRMFIRTSRTSVKAGNVVIQLVGEYMCEKKGKLQKKILTSGKYPDIQTGKIEVVKKYATNK
jgi:ribonuclease-3